MGSQMTHRVREKQMRGKSAIKQRSGPNSEIMLGTKGALARSRLFLLHSE